MHKKGYFIMTLIVYDSSHVIISKLSLILLNHLYIYTTSLESICYHDIGSQVKSYPQILK